VPVQTNREGSVSAPMPTVALRGREGSVATPMPTMRREGSVATAMPGASMRGREPTIPMPPGMTPGGPLPPGMTPGGPLPPGTPASAGPVSSAGPIVREGLSQQISAQSILPPARPIVAQRQISPMGVVLAIVLVVLAAVAMFLLVRPS
jgi:hypothetical protein